MFGTLQRLNADPSNHWTEPPPVLGNRESAPWNAPCSKGFIEMAYLNVRDRRLETKIAYVGPELSGRATNFERLGGGQLGDDLLALEWTPRSTASFRDCEVRVKLVTSRGASTGEQLIELLRDADGIVFVADAQPSAEERNRESLALVREALATRLDHDVPVVVQVNKTDLPDAIAPATLVERLDVGDWPHVKAAAARGEGVVETLERAYEKMLDALLKKEANGSANGASRERPAVLAAPREGNPMLAALRQVLRDTVFAQVDELESRLTSKIERIFREQRGTHDSAPGAHRADELAELRGAIESMRSQLETLHTATNEANAAAAATLREIRSELSTQRAELDALAERFASVDERTDVIVTNTSSILLQRESLIALRERMDDVRRAAEAERGTFDTWRRAVDEKLDAAANQQTYAADMLSVMDLGLRTSAAELTRALEASARAEVERWTATNTQLKRAIDAVASEVKSADARAHLGPIKTSVENVANQAASLVAAVKPIAALLPRLEQAETVLKRELRGGIEIVAGKIDAAHDETATALASAEAKTLELQALVIGIDEELKKPKKGWFA